MTLKKALEEEYGDEIPNAETLKAFEDIDNRRKSSLRERLYGYV